MALVELGVIARTKRRRRPDQALALDKVAACSRAGCARAWSGGTAPRWRAFVGGIHQADGGAGWHPKFGKQSDIGARAAGGRIRKRCVGIAVARSRWRPSWRFTPTSSLGYRAMDEVSMIPDGALPYEMLAAYDSR